jgi:hypothetical protein
MRKSSVLILTFIPINDAVVRMIKEIEGGQRKMTPENLKDPVFANL